MNESTTPLMCDKAKIMDALRLPQYVWRTAEGVARDSGVPLHRVIQIMVAADNEVCLHPEWKADGRHLFAARDHLIKSMTWWERLRAAFRGRLY